MDGPVSFQTVALSKPCMANITLVWFLPCVYPKVAFQLEGIRACISAVGTLIRPLTTMTSHVAFQLAQLYRGVVTVRTLMWFLMSVFVAHMSHKFATGCKVCLAILATVWLCSCVRVHVVLKRSERFETSLAYAALVRSFFAVRLHVP